MVTSERPVAVIKDSIEHRLIHEESFSISQCRFVLIMENGETVEEFSDVLRIIQMGEVVPHWSSAYRHLDTGDLFYTLENPRLDHVL